MNETFVWRGLTFEWDPDREWYTAEIPDPIGGRWFVREGLRYGPITPGFWWAWLEFVRGYSLLRHAKARDAALDLSHAVHLEMALKTVQQLESMT